MTKDMPALTVPGPGPSLDAVFRAAETGPCMVHVPGQGDIVVMTAALYAELLDQVETMTFLDGDAAGQDPLLAGLAQDHPTSSSTAGDDG